MKTIISIQLSNLRYVNNLLKNNVMKNSISLYNTMDPHFSLVFPLERRDLLFI